MSKILEESPGAFAQYLLYLIKIRHSRDPFVFN